MSGEMENSVYLNTGVLFPFNLIGREEAEKRAYALGFHKLQIVPVRRDKGVLISTKDRQSIGDDRLTASKSAFVQSALGLIYLAGMGDIKVNLSKLNPDLPTQLPKELIDAAIKLGFKDLSVRVEDQSWESIQMLRNKEIGLAMDTQLTPVNLWRKIFTSFPESISEINISSDIKKPEGMQMLRDLVWGNLDSLAFLKQAPKNAPMVLNISMQTIRDSGLGTIPWAFRQINRHVLAAAERN